MTGPRGRLPPRRSMSAMVLPSPGHEISRLTGTMGRSGDAEPVYRPVIALVAELVQELVRGLTDALEPADVRHRQIRVGDVPTFCIDLVTGEVVLRARAANPRPAFESTIQDIQIVGDLRREVVDVGIPLAVEGGAEEQLRVVVQEHEAHVVEAADLVRAVEVASQQLQLTRCRYNLPDPRCPGAVDARVQQ